MEINALISFVAVWRNRFSTDNEFIVVVWKCLAGFDLTFQLYFLLIRWIVAMSPCSGKSLKKDLRDCLFEKTSHWFLGL